jgi:hypothetical protein
MLEIWINIYFPDLYRISSKILTESNIHSLKHNEIFSIPITGSFGFANFFTGNHAPIAEE